MLSIDVAPGYPNPVKVAGSVLLSADYTYMQVDITRSPLGSKAAKMTYEMAGLNPEDLGPG